MNSNLIRNQVAIVTGGSSGIGKAITQELLEANMKVIVVDIVEPGEDELFKGFKNVAYIQFDLFNTSSFHEIIDFTNETFGGIDLLINCAGVYPSKPALQIGEDEWDQVIDLNLKVPFLLSKKTANYMIKKKTGGSIINIASSAASMPRPGISHYAASKAGLVMLTRVLALEWAPFSIRVNAICPGVVETDTLLFSLKTEQMYQEHKEKISKIPLARAATPNDITKSVLFLANPAYSGYITGQSIYIDGGYTSGQVYSSFGGETFS